MMPSGHKAFLVQNPTDVDLLLMHNKTFAAEYAFLVVTFAAFSLVAMTSLGLLANILGSFRIGHAVSSRKRVEIIAKAKALGVKVINPKGRVRTQT